MNASPHNLGRVVPRVTFRLIHPHAFCHVSGHGMSSAMYGFESDNSSGAISSACSAALSFAVQSGMVTLNLEPSLGMLSALPDYTSRRPEPASTNCSEAGESPDPLAISGCGSLTAIRCELVYAPVFTAVGETGVPVILPIVEIPVAVSTMV